MNIKNKKEVDTFLWEHRDNGCIGIKSNDTDDAGLTYNIAWKDAVTGEIIKVEYEHRAR